MADPISCPACGHDKISADFACHTWPGGTRPDGTEQWMSCQDCGSAIEYSCGCWLDDEVPNPDDPDGRWIYREPDCTCDWSYRHGLNPRNPRWAKEQEHRPVWLQPEPEFTDRGDILKHPDVRWRWEEASV